MTNMANRAYLFPADSPTLDWPDMVSGESHHYYDSRHALPLAWLFFFRTTDIKLDGDEIYFASDRKSACDYFLTRKSLVQDIAGTKPDYLEEIHSNVSEWPSGDFLVMRPVSVGDFYSENLTYIQQILSTIAMPDTNVQLVIQTIQQFTGQPIPTRFGISDRDERDLIGCTYG